MTDVLERAGTDGLDAGPRPSAPLPVPRAPKAAPRLQPSEPDPRRLFLLLPFAVIGGEIFYVGLDTEPQPLLLAAGAVALLPGLVLGRHTRWLRHLLLLAVALWAGISILPLHRLLAGDVTMLDRPAYGTFRARVETVTPDGLEDMRVVIADIVPTGHTRPVTINKARILIKAGPNLAPGDRIEGGMRFYPVPGPVLPNGYDTQFQSYFDGVTAFGNAAADIVVTPPATTDFGRAVEALRQGIGMRIDAAIAGEAQGVARSMMIGDQSRISDEVRDAMANSGLAHIYSISGLHLSLVALGVLALTRMLLVWVPGLSRRVSIKKLAAIVALAASFVYLLLAGGSSNVPAFRSTLMIALVLGAVLAGRRALTMRNVAFAALAIIALDPASVFRPSFQLSFAAVVALIGIYETLQRRSEPKAGLGRKVIGAITGTALTSLIAGTATLLFSAYHFQQTAPLGVVANLMALVLIMPIMSMIVLGTLLMPLGWEGPALQLLGWLIDALIGIARLVAAWGEGLSLHPLLTPLSLILGLAALGWFALLPSWWRLAGPALLVPAVLLFCIDRPPDILVADSSRALAVRTEEGLHLYDGKDTSFAVTVWSETYGEPIVPAVGEDCDAIGCWIAGRGGFKAAIIDDPAGFYEDCAEADVVITRRTAPAICTAPLVIDAGSLTAGGVHWLRWLGDRFALRVARNGLSRPWRAAPP